MRNYDYLISKVFFKDNKLYIKYFRRFFKNPIKYKDKYKNIKEYLSNRFIDSKDIRETLYRIYRNIEIRPVCKICGKELDLQIVNKKNQVFPIYCSISCEMKDPEVMKKHNNSCLKKYGSVNNSEKTKETCLKKYGVKAGFNNGKEKITKLKKYGNAYFVNPKKAKETCLKKYGVDHPMKIENIKNKINYKEQKIKEYITKRKNNSFNKSYPEDESYILLKEKYTNIIRQYRSELYPFCCDFYVPSLDLYIECNYHWTHGGKLYEGTEEDNKLLQQWKDKHTKYYENAIKTWTYYDIKKNNIAKNNNLNYLIFYNFNDFYEWIKK